jgi:hypothetical protein
MANASTSPNTNISNSVDDNGFMPSFNSQMNKDYNFMPRSGSYQRDMNKPNNRSSYDRKSGGSRSIHTPPLSHHLPNHHSKKTVPQHNTNQHSNYNHPVQHHQQNSMPPYPSNMNEMLMKEMAQKMFASVYSQIQSQQQQQQQQQKQYQHQPLINAHMGSQMRHKF